MKRLLLFWMGIPFFISVFSWSQVDLSGEWHGFYELESENFIPGIVVILTSDGGTDSYTGEYHTETGIDGTVTLTVDENNFVLGLADNSATCPGTFHGSGAIKDPVMFCIGSGSDCSGVTQNQRLVICRMDNLLDSQTWIDLSQRTNYFGTESGSIWTHVEDSNGLVSGIFVTPLLDEYEMKLTSGGTELEFSYDFEWLELEWLFPDGIYVSRVIKQGEPPDKEWIVYTRVCTPFPDTYPEISTPSASEMIPLNTAFSVEWNTWASPPDNNGGWYSDSNEIKSHSIDPESDASVNYLDTDFSSSQSLRMHLSFQTSSPNSSFPVLYPYYSTKSKTYDTFVELGEPLQEYQIMFGKNKDHLNEIGYFYMFDVAAPESMEVRVTTPGNEEINLPYDSQTGSFDLIEAVAEDAFLTRFTNGTYLINTTRTQTPLTAHRQLNLSEDFPDVYPEITAPIHGSIVDRTQPFLDVTWNAWAGSGGMVMLYKVEEIPTALEIYPDNQLVWMENVDPSASLHRIPTGILKPDSCYELSVMFSTGSNYRLSRVTRKCVYFYTNYASKDLPVFLEHWHALICEPKFGITCEQTDINDDGKTDVLDIIEYFNSL